MDLKHSLHKLSWLCTYIVLVLLIINHLWPSASSSYLCMCHLCPKILPLLLFLIVIRANPPSRLIKRRGEFNVLRRPFINWESAEFRLASIWIHLGLLVSFVEKLWKLTLQWIHRIKIFRVRICYLYVIIRSYNKYLVLDCSCHLSIGYHNPWTMNNIVGFLFYAEL